MTSLADNPTSSSAFPNFPLHRRYRRLLALTGFAKDPYFRKFLSMVM
jgi:hypothetical protein